MEESPATSRGYLRLVRRIAGHWRLSLAIFGALAIPIAVWALVFLPKSYEAVATIFLEDPRRASAGSIKDWMLSNDASLQQALLRSRSLAEAVVQNLPRESMDELLGRAMHRDYVLAGQNLIRRVFGRDPIVHAPQQRAVGELQGARVRFVSLPSGEVEIRAIAYHPQVAMDVANTYVAVLKARSRSHIQDEARATRQFIESLLAQTRTGLQEAEERAATLTRGRGARTPERSSFELAQLAQLENALADIQASREIAKVRLSALREGKAVSFTGLPGPRPGNDRLLALESRLAALQEKYTEQHPAVRALQAEIRDTNAALVDRAGGGRPLPPAALSPADEAVRGKQVADLELELSSLSAREEFTKQRIARLSGNLSALGAEDLEASKVTRKLEAQRNLLATLTEKLGTARVQEQGEDRGLIVIDAATLPVSPSSAPARKMMLLGVLVSLGLGISAAVVIEYFNQPVETEDDIVEITGLPVLGWLPTVPGPRPTGTGQRTPLNFVEDTIPDTLPVEMCRAIRTSLEWVSGQRQVRTVMLASAGPGEGKSTLAVNLAWVFWELGRRVLLVDGDLRRPSLHKALGYPAQGGAADVLAGRLRLDGAGHAVREGFTLLPAGSTAGTKPGVLLTVERLRPLLDTVKGQVDLVIFDSAPVLAVADNLVLASLVDGVVLVARAGKTQHRELARAKDALERAGATLLGAVLNEMSLRETRRAYGAYGDYYRTNDAPAPPWWRRWWSWGLGLKGVSR